MPEGSSTPSSERFLPILNLRELIEMRRWTSRFSWSESVLPAYAGMILARQGPGRQPLRAPRVCGDDPWYDADADYARSVLPAYAGMIPRTPQSIEQTRVSFATVMGPPVCQGVGTTCLAQWASSGVVGPGVNCGFLAAPVGRAFDDEFVGGGGQSIDRRLGQQWVGHDGQPFVGAAV